jgi:dsDNA-specific endonuclease/ATPase MutS2
MNSKSIRSLEFDKIRMRLATHTSFSASEELARELTPLTDPAEIKARQQMYVPIPVPRGSAPC